jgi:hypothetical protein
MPDAEENLTDGVVFRASGIPESLWYGLPLQTDQGFGA